MGVAETTPDPLLGGFYTVSEAARLLRIDNRQRIYRWLRPAEDGKGAVIARDYEPFSKFQELSFWDLIEVRFVEHFRAQRLSLQYLRKVAVRAREEFSVQHPFALSNAKFLTDRKRIFEQTAEEEGLKVHELLSGQYEMYEVIEEILAKGIAFDPKTFLAKEWRPLQNFCPNVIVNPRYAYGYPVVGDNHVPTAAIYRQWQAERGDRERVMGWWDVGLSDVDEAVEFEIRITA